VEQEDTHRGPPRGDGRPTGYPPSRIPTMAAPAPPRFGW
jgi:hypothetical protein